MLELARGCTRTRIYMDTPVVIEIAAPDEDEVILSRRADSAFAWFGEVERTCSRFDEASELRAISRRIGEPVPVSTLLFRALEFALRVARLTDGALDPTVGRAMERAGFNTNYLTGERLTPPGGADISANYRDIVLDEAAQTVTLLRPVSLDLGAVAKGLAIDLAAQELKGLPGSIVNAGGDIFASGCNADGEPWQIGIRHPRRLGELIASLRITGAAICTSGDYERSRPQGDGHHIINPALGTSAGSAASVTVVAPTAMAADALSTAAFVLGPRAGASLLARMGVEGVIVGSDLDVIITPGMENYLA